MTDENWKTINYENEEKEIHVQEFKQTLSEYNEKQDKTKIFDHPDECFSEQGDQETKYCLLAENEQLRKESDFQIIYIFF